MIKQTIARELKDYVNITLGLPIIRMSVDHGTGFALAGKGTANALSLVNAIDYALTMYVAEHSWRWLSGHILGFIILLLPLEGTLPGEEQMREQLLSVYNVTVPMHTDGTQEGFRRVCRVYRREGI